VSSPSANATSAGKSASQKPASQKPGLVASLGLFSATAIVVGSMIGSGIFIVPADISRGVGSPAHGW
jgi:APA family basic amino acid/polyamine antiporter